MSKSISITIGPAGEIKTDINGVKGDGCKAITAIYTDKFGGADKTVDKPELYETATEQEGITA